VRTLDLILLIPLLFGAYIGYKRGLLMELVGIIALVLAILGAFKLIHSGIEFLQQYIPEHSNFIPFIAFIGIFIGILILVNLIGRITKKLLDLTILGIFDNLAGAILGVFKWAFIISIVLWLTSQINVTVPENLTENSFLYDYIYNLAPRVGQYVSSIFPFADNLFESIKELFN
jgi:membrane protein required for colicin V production